MVNLDNATFVGEDEWVKDSAYQVYEVDGKYYAVIVVGHSSKEILQVGYGLEIKKEDINKYI